MIGGLQGEFGDLDIKYLKQNIPKYLKMLVENIRKLQENTAALYTERKTLQVSTIKRSGYVYPEKLKRPPLPSGCEISGCTMSAHEILDVKCPTSPDYPDQFHPDSPKRKGGAMLSGFPKRKGGAMLSGFSQGEAHVTHQHHTRTIAYPIRICCPDGKHWLKRASLATAHVPPLSNGVFRTPCPDIFAMDSKELSSISDWFGDQKAIKTPKLNTIWLELIARVLNMLIGLKGDNYYSKVFKRVNYRLSNNTFWVVIIRNNLKLQH